MEFSRNYNPTKADKLQASQVEGILRKKIAFLSGGKDKLNRPIITIPDIKEPIPYTPHEFRTTLNYLQHITKGLRKFTILVDIRLSAWNAAKPVLHNLQEYMRDQIGLLCIVKPTEFVEKRKARFSFTKYKNKLGFIAILTSASKLTRHIDPSQLTVEFGGKLQYSHQQWLDNILSFDVYLNEAKKTIHDLKETNENRTNSISESSTDWSDSGHHTGQMSTSTSSFNDVLGSKSGIYRVNVVDRSRSIDQGREYGQNWSGVESSDKTTSSQSPPTKPLRYAKKRKERFEKARKRSRSMSPRGVRRNERISSTPEFESRFHDPSSNYHQYSVPYHRKQHSSSSSTTSRLRRSKSDYYVNAEEVKDSNNSIYSRTTSGYQNDYVNSPEQKSNDLPRSYRRDSTPHLYERPISRSNSIPSQIRRSKSEQNVDPHPIYSQPKQSTSRNGPRPLRRRNRENSRDMKGTKLLKSKSVPNLNEATNHIRRNSTILKGEKLLKSLSSTTDENGFALNAHQRHISDEAMRMIEEVNKCQKTLEKLEKTKTLLERKRSKRKSIVGIPEVDQLTNRSTDLTVLTPLEMKDNLKLVFDWLRGDGKKKLTSLSAYGLTLTKIDEDKKCFDLISSNYAKNVKLLTNTKRAFESVTSTNPSSRKYSRATESTPQWMISLKKNIEVVENHCKTFRSILNRIGDIMNSSSLFFSCAKQLSKFLHLCIGESYKNEATLLDDLETIQERLDQLEECCQNTDSLHKEVNKKAVQHFSLIRKKMTSDPDEQNRAQQQKNRIQEILTQLKCGIERCTKLTDACKVHLTQVYQLKTAKNDVQQSVEWLCETSSSMQDNQSGFGQSSRDIDDLINKHENLEKTGKAYFDKGNKQLSSMSVLRRCLELSPPQGAAHTTLTRNSSSTQLVSKSGKLLPSLEEAWELFDKAWTERRSKLLIIQLFYEKAEQLIKRGSRIEEDLDQIYQGSNIQQPLTPLRDAHHVFHGDWSNVKQLGDFILNETTNHPGLKNNDMVKFPIHHHLNQLEEMLTSLQLKWSRVNRETPTPRSLSSGGSRLTNWFENVSEMTDWVRKKSVELSRNIFEIGRSLKESLSLRHKFERLVAEVKNKNDFITSIVNEEEQDQTPSYYNLSTSPHSSHTRSRNRNDDHKVHTAITRSLLDLWKELDALLIRRHAVLFNSVNFHNTAEEFGNKLTCLEQYLKWDDLPLDEYTARSLLQILKEMYDKMTEDSYSVLDEEKNLLTVLNHIKADDPDTHKHTSFGSACVTVECVIRSLMERKTLMEFQHEKRKKHLEHSLRVTEWEKKVDEVANWFETVREVNLERSELGVDESNTKAILCHMDQIKDHAQDRLERAKKLIALATDELKAFGNDSVKLQSRGLDEIGESFMRRVDERKRELQSALDFYHHVKEAEISLDNLEEKLKLGRFSSDQDEADEQRRNYIDCVNAAAEPVLTKASIILMKSQDDFEAVEGIAESRDNVVNKQLHLLELIDQHSRVSSQLNETLSMFMSNCDEIKNKIKDIEDDALQACDSLTSNSDEAKKFREWHQLLLDDVENENDKITSIVDTANVLLENGVSNSSQVKSQAESLKSAWFNLKHKITQRVELADKCIDFLIKVELLSDEIEAAHELVAEQSKKSPNQLEASLAAKVEESANHIDAECLDLMEKSNQLNIFIKQFDLESSSAATALTQKVVELHRKKSRFKDVWLAWRYKSGVTQDTSAQLITVEKTIDALLLSLEKIEQLVFLNKRIYLGKDEKSNRILFEGLKERQSSLDVIKTEITETVKHAEMLGMRLSSSRDSAKEEERSQEEKLRGLVKNLLFHHQDVQKKLKDCKSALTMALTCFESMRNMRKIMQDYKKRIRDTSSLRSSNRDLFLLDLKLGEYDVICKQLDDLMDSIKVISEKIRNFLKKTSLNKICENAEDFEQAVVEIETEFNSWKKSQNSGRENLLNQKELLDFNQDLEKQEEKLTEATKRLKDLKEQMMNCQSRIEAVALREEFLDLLDDAKKHEKEWSHTVVSLESRAVNTEPVDGVIEATRQDITNVASQAEKLCKSAATLEKVFKLSDECDKWNEEIQEIISKVRSKSSSIRSSQEADELSEFLETNLKSRIAEQTERSEKVASVLVEEEKIPISSPPNQDVLVPGLSEEEKVLRSLLRRKQNHVKESLRALRSEIDDLSEVIERAKQRFSYSDNQLYRAKPHYDLSVLYDENLPKKKASEKAADNKVQNNNQKISKRPKIVKVSPSRRDDFLSSSASSLTLSSTTTSSNLYELSEDSTTTFLDDDNEDWNNLTNERSSPRDLRQNPSNSELNISAAINKALNSKTNQEIRSPPPRLRKSVKNKVKSPRTDFGDFYPHGSYQTPKHSPRYYGNDVENDDNHDENNDDEAKILKELITKKLSVTSKDINPLMIKSLQIYKKISPKTASNTTSPKNAQYKTEKYLSPLSLSLNTSFSSCDTDLLLQVDGFTGLDFIVSGSAFYSDTSDSSEKERKLFNPEIDENNFQLNKNKQRVKLQTSKLRHKCRVSKPRNSIKTTQVFPHQIIESSSPVFFHKRSESFLSSSSSVWDTDCLIAADPRSTKIPSVLLHSARNEMDFESDQTEDLLQCDPFLGFDSGSTDETVVPREKREKENRLLTPNDFLSPSSAESWEQASSEMADTSCETVIIVNNLTATPPLLRIKSFKEVDHHSIFSSQEINCGKFPSTMSTPSFKQGLKGVASTEGGVARFDVIVAGKPLPKIRWYHNGNDVSSSHNYQVTTTAEGRSSLQIAEVFDEDAGEFRCCATNQHGEATSSAELVVTKTNSNVGSSSVNTANFHPAEFDNLHHKKGNQIQRRPGHVDEVMNGLEAKRKVWRDLNDSLHGDIYKSDTGYTSMSSSVNGKQLEKAVHGNEFSAFSSSVHFDECNDLSSLSSMEAKAADLFSTSSMLFVNQDFAFFPPFIKSKGSELEVKEGEMSLLSCEVMGNPIPHVIWYREGARIDSSHDFEISFTGKISTLFIRDTSSDDAGTYTCSASNEAGSASSVFRLRVIPDLLEFKKTNPAQPASEIDLSITDYEGTEAELDFVSGVSDAEITDTEMFNPVSSSNPKSNQNIGTDSSATLDEEKSLQNESKYKTSGKPPKFETFPPDRILLVEGGSIRLDCVISGTPPPLVTWSKNEVMLKTGYRYRINEDLEKNKYSLQIGMLLVEDAGEFKVTATNQFGFITGSIFLLSEDESQQKLLETSPRKHVTNSTTQESDKESRPHSGYSLGQTTSDTKRNFISPSIGRTGRSPMPKMPTPHPQDDDIVPETEKYFKPKFLIKPGSRECKEGETIRIDCKVTGRPTPEVTFLRYGSGVEDSRHRVVVKEDGIHSLIISPVRPDDTGEYTVRAESRAGKEECDMDLTVLAQEDSEAPRILEKPQSISVKEGDLVRLEVFAVGKPTPEIAWLKDNLLLRPDKHPEIRIEGVDGHGLLTIEKAYKGFHDAWYTATAVNKSGRDLTRCKVTVLKSDDEPMPERKSYVPKPKKTSAGHKFSMGQTELHKMREFSEDDLYRMGSMQKPMFKRKLKSRKQKTLGSVHFECVVIPVGDPSMKIEWLLEGKPLECANRIKENFEFGHASLDMSTVYPRDTGVISCRVSNEHGQAQSSCTLIVKEEQGLDNTTQLCDEVMLERIQDTEKHRQEMSLIHDSHLTHEETPPSAPKVVLPLEPVRVREGESAKFQCRVLGHPAPTVEWFVNKQIIRPNKRFRIWQDGIHYFEIKATRNYDNGTLRLIAENKFGSDEASTTIEVYQGHDMRSVLHKTPNKQEAKPKPPGFKQHRMAKNLEDKFRGEKGKHMVQLKEVNKPNPGMKSSKKVEREDELQRKFSHLSEEDHLLKTYEADKKKANERDRDYEHFIRQTKNDLVHRDKSPGKQSGQVKNSDRHSRAFRQVDGLAPPVIEQHISNLSIASHKHAMFRVRFKGDAKANVAWFKNQTEVEKSERVEVVCPEDGVSELHINNVTANDSGSVSVQISNAAGKVSSQCFLSVQDPNNDLHFFEPLYDLSAKEHDTSVIFECRLSEMGLPVAWYYSTEPESRREIPNKSEKYQTLIEGPQHYLRISDICLSDAGTYSCVATAANNKQVETSAQLSVEATDKTITSGLTEQLVDEGGNGRFASVVSHGNVDGSWLKDGKEIKSSDKFDVGHSGTKHSLVVRNCRLDDAGIYEFKYDNCSSKASLSVEGMHVKIVEDLKPLKAFSGESATFTCKLSRSDALGSWKHNDCDVTPSDRVVIGSDISTYFLKICACEEQDKGDYSFSASDVETKTSLDVQDVKVVDEIHDVTAIESNEVTFACKVDQSNYKSGKWFKDGNEILPDGAKYKIITTGHNQELIVKEVTKDRDSGSYAYVSGSGSYAQAQLHVVQVDVTQPLVDVRAFESTTAKFDICLSHEGAVGIWYRNGEFLNLNNRRKYENNGTNHSLLISDLTLEDEGEYEFRFANKSFTSYLKINEVNFTQTLSDVSVTESNDVVLQCEAESEGLFGMWLKNNQIIEFDNEPRYQYLRQGRFHQLAIEKVHKQDDGKFIFQIGRSSTEARLDVTEIRFSKGLRNITVSEGSDACFKVEISNNNVNEVCWEKNCTPIPDQNQKYTIARSGKVSTLTVHSVSMQDEATYTCKAGSAQTSARLYVEEVEKKQKESLSKSFIEDFQMANNDEEKSEQSTFNTDKSLLTSYHTVQISGAGDKQSVTNKKVGGEKNIVNYEQAHTDVVKPAFVTSLPENIVVNEKQTAMFECELSPTNSDRSLLQWRKDGKLIESEDRIKISQTGLIHQLIINDSKLGDAGTYEFQYGDYKNTALLKVMKVDVIVKNEEDEVVANENDFTAIQFHVNKLDVIGSWSKNGNIIDLTEQTRLKYEVDGFDHRLEIHDLSKSDCGEYKFQVQNSIASTHLLVNKSSPSKVLSEKVEVRSIKPAVNGSSKKDTLNTNQMPVRNSPKPLPPSIVTPLEDCITREGGKGRFCWEVSGVGVDVVWSRNGEEIQDDPYYNVSRTQDYYMLEIPKVSSDDLGNYEVVVRNEQGEVSCSACLKLGNIDPPFVVKPLQPVHVIEGSAVRLEWKVKGAQLEVRWYKRGHDITDDDRYKWRLDRKTGCCYLVIPDCSIDDAGEIRCRVSNIAGEVICSTDLRVSGVRRSKKINNSSDINFDVSPFLNDSQTDQLQVKSSMTGKQFTIRRSNVNHLVGNYISQSDIDPSLSDSPILAKARPNPLSELDDDLIAPAFTRKPKLQSVLTDSSAIFRCSFVASPRPKVTWYHCDSEIKRNSDRHVMTLEREMLSYRACLEVKNCTLEDAGVYRITLNNKRGETFSEACLVVTEKDSVISHLNDDFDTSSCGTYCDGPERLKTYLSESDLHKLGQENILKRLQCPLESNSAPGSGTITPRQPFSPRLYYQRRNRGLGSTLSSEVGSIEASERDSHASKVSDFDQSFSSVSSLSSFSNTSPTRLANSFDSDDYSSLSRSLSSADQRKLNSIKTVFAAGLQRPKNNFAFSDFENLSARSLDERSISALSELSAVDSNADLPSRSALKMSKRIAPKIVSPLPESIVIIAGNQLTLSCVVSAFPRCNIVWLKNAENISNNSEYSSEKVDFFLNTGDTACRLTLTVSNVSSSHSGTYTLTAFNRLGDATTETKVKVQ